MGRLGGFAPAEAERGEQALWLAGGGHRAALFHLGALTRLNELGMPARTGTVGAVAGGSILAALLATRLPWPLDGPAAEWEEKVAEPLRAIARSGARTRPLLPPRDPDAAAERCARELASAGGGEPEHGPRLVFGDSGLTLSGLAAGWEECLEWSLDDPSPGGYDGRVLTLIAALPPGLAALGEGTGAVLENHGYLLAEAALRDRGPELVEAMVARPPTPPHPDWLDPERVRSILGSSARRAPLGRRRPR